ncbi:MAG TPA: IS1634 family transposase [Pyrinomonadaceae bacterium]|nr:IS1634 family transposase [Pyrinomonadaceae bacterium]
MFLRRYQRKKSGKVHVYYALVESMRTEAGPRQHVVAHLGELSSQQQRRWERTLVFYNRHGDAEQLQLFPDEEEAAISDDPTIARVRLDQIGWTNARAFGDVWLAWQLWRLLKLDEIIARHLPRGAHTVAPADVVAIEVINRLCAPVSEFALAEHWYASTGLEDLLGVANDEITKDRLYRTTDALRNAKEAIENDLKERLGTLFQLDYDLLLYDLTSSYFEGVAEGNPLAKRGYSRDHRNDCKQIVLALVVTREGFPLAHCTLAGNAQDVQTVEKIVGEVERRFGRSQRIWVMDRGMVSKANVKFLSESDRQYVLGTRRTELAYFQAELRSGGWQWIRDEVQVKAVKREEVAYLLVRSAPRRRKERSMRRRQTRGLREGLRKLQRRVRLGRLKQRDKILELVGQLKGRYVQAARLVSIEVSTEPIAVSWRWNAEALRTAFCRDGAYLLQSNYRDWNPEQFWETYVQLATVERAFRVLKSELLIRPVWHQLSGRVEAHVMICVLAYALWKTLDHLAKEVGLMTLIQKPSDDEYPRSPQPRPMSPQSILREFSKIQIGDILLTTTDGRQLALRRVARPLPEQARILEALQRVMPDLALPERLSCDRLL